MEEFTCKVEGCDRGLYANAKRLCSAHYQQELAGKPFSVPRPFKARRDPHAKCRFPECENLSTTKGLCRRHYDQSRNGRGLRPLGPVRRPIGERNERGEKWCPRCQSWVPVSGFTKSADRSDGLQSCCRACRAKIYKDNAEKVRDSMRKSRFGLSREEFYAKLASQGGRCAICMSDDPGGQYWSVDHDHACCPTDGKSCGECVRGILCSPCNRSLGMMREDVDSIMRMADYVRLWSASTRTAG